MNGTEDRDDAALVRAARSGDRKAFTVLYRRHCTGVARALASYAGNDRAAIDDLTQDVFVRVIENLDRYVPRRPFTHWLYTIALNVGRNHVRNRSRVVPLESAGSPGAPPGLDTAGLRAAAMHHVARLPEGTRDVVALRIAGDLGFAEIAEVLEIPEGTARRRMHDALHTLRAALGATRKDRA